MSQSETITPKQLQLINFLLQGENITHAAALAQVSTRQVYRWIRQDECFRKTLRGAQGVMLDATGARLVELASTAVDVLSDLMENPPGRADAPGAGVQLRAALGVLDTCLRWKEQVDFEQRLAELEGEIHGQSSAKKKGR